MRNNLFLISSLLSTTVIYISDITRFVDQMSSIGRGYGKIILFNEHFVVYGIPAIASAIDRYVEVKITDSEELEIFDERLKRTNDKIEMKILNTISSKIGVDLSKNPIKIEIRGDLPLGSGLGASAATCVALSRALSNHFNLNLRDEEINELAYYGEKIFHGTPSGIDNTVSTFGGVIWFEREKNIERITLGKPLYIVIGNTGIPSSTKKAVEKVRKRRERERERFDEIFEEARSLAYDSRRYLEMGDLDKIGECMTKNHALLKEIGVSCKELDMLVELSLKSGALGAKLTGGGLGGNMIALVKDEKDQDIIAREFEKRGFKSMKVKVG